MSNEAVVAAIGVVGTLAGTIGGLIGGVLVQYLREKGAAARDVAAREQLRQEARSDFQRQALLDLQEALSVYIRALTNLESNDAVREALELSWRFQAVKNKVADDGVRHAAEAFGTAATAIGQKGSESTEAEARAMHDRAVDLLDVIGEVMRTYV